MSDVVTMHFHRMGEPFSACGEDVHLVRILVTGNWDLVTCEDCKKERDSRNLTKPKVQMEVTFIDDTTRNYAVNSSWHVDMVRNELVVGKALERTHIPLYNVRSYGPRPYDGKP